MKTGVYPGSFDPITYGHLDIIKRASSLVDTLLVAVGTNPSKNALFDVDERIALIRQCVGDLHNVVVDRFQGLLVRYAKEKNANTVFKGLRAVSDFEIEFQTALVNRELEPQVETVFLMTDYKYAFLSSSLVKEVADLGGDIQKMVPPCVEKELQEKLKQARMMPK